MLDNLLRHDGFTLLEEELAAEYARLTTKLERMGLPEAEANYIRGQLYTLRSLQRTALAKRFRYAQEGPDA